MTNVKARMYTGKEKSWNIFFLTAFNIITFLADKQKGKGKRKGRVFI